MPPYRAPIKSSVHRYACLALYRALARGTRLENVSPDARDVIRTTVEQRFRVNRELQKKDELRAALVLGYRTLQILRDAAVEGPNVVDDLVATILRICPPSDGHKKKKKPGKPASAEVPGSTRPAAKPGQASQHIVLQRPLPLRKLKGGVRRVPTLQFTGGVPFLRTTKPQPAIVSLMIRRQKEKHQKLTNLRKVLVRQLPDHRAEDAWDLLLRDRHRVPADADVKWADTAETILRDATKAQTAFFKQRTRRTEQLMDIVKREKALAAAEKEERKQQRRALRQQQQQQQQKAAEPPIDREEPGEEPGEALKKATTRA